MTTANAAVGFDETEVMDRLPKAVPGADTEEYVAEVTKLRFFFSQNQGGNIFIPELKVVKAITPDAAMKSDYEFADPHYHYGPNREMFFRLTKKFLGALTDERASKIKSSDLEEAAGDDQPCAGLKVIVRVTPGISKKRNTFAKLEYETYRE